VLEPLLIEHFDVETNTGTVLLDNQDELPIDAETFASSGLMELRLGQRVRFDIDEEAETMYSAEVIRTLGIRKDAQVEPLLRGDFPSEELPTRGEEVEHLTKPPSRARRRSAAEGTARRRRSGRARRRAPSGPRRCRHAVGSQRRDRHRGPGARDRGAVRTAPHGMGRGRR
jgi:cold shock CspA family protein